MSKPVRVLVVSFKFLPEYAGWLQQTLTMTQACDSGKVTFKWIYPDSKTGQANIRKWKNLTEQPIKSSFACSTQTDRIRFSLSAVRYLVAHHQSYDLIFCPSAYTPSDIIILAAALLKIPRVVRVAQGEIATSYFNGRVRRRLFLALASALVVLNYNLYESLKWVVPDKVFWHPNGVDTERFKPAFPIERCEIRKQWHIEESQQAILFVGSIVARKGIDILVSAFAEIAKSNDKCMLFLVGPVSSKPDSDHGELKTSFVNHLQMMINQYGLEDRVKFIGQLSNTEELMQMADIFVLPSLAEGMPNVLLEAMASGLPCVASDIPGIQELIVPHQNGLLFPPKDTQSLAQQLKWLLVDQSQRSQLGQQARETILESFSIKDTAKRYQDLFIRLGGKY